MNNMFSSILWILIINMFAYAKNDTNLFAGNGLTTYGYTINHGIIEMNCSDYDDCYSLLCEYTWIPTYYLIIIKPNDWDGNCDKLNNSDSRQFDAEIDVFDGNKVYETYITSNVSDASIWLCMINKNKNVTHLEYYGDLCLG